MSPFRASAPLTERWEHFSLEVDDGVATLSFSRPDKLNALTFEAYADLRDVVAELPHHGDARVLVITGEGRLDAQSLAGKAPVGVMRRAHERGIPVIALAGSLGDDVEDLLAAGMTAVLSVVPGAMDLDEALRSAATSAKAVAR